MADPSKIEKKVMEMVRSRVENHEMRNQARKLTPAERKAKKDDGYFFMFWVFTFLRKKRTKNIYKLGSRKIMKSLFNWDPKWSQNP